MQKCVFHLICVCHVYVPMQILGDQKGYRFSSTQLMIFLLVIQSSYFSQ